ncbi:permease [Vibrio orientalis CIP 102891 = ATCC 33934]|uniref:Permease n=1 Tax=Vibrio orientalis CIP 102891 = ATCC 33934 TaxID=675816 RepID=A0ABP2GXJ6_VIBOR|nr:permease [Vibrio orientalis CIP 102891 = ATCC 33934]
MLILCAAQVGTSGDNATVGVSASALVQQFGASMDQIQMANATYSLIAGAMMIAGGLIGLILGWRRSFRIGLVLLAVSEVVAAFSPSIEVFIYGARVMTGAGASLTIPAVLGLIAGNYQGKDQALAFSGLAAASGLSAALMPVVFGMLLDVMGLRFTYLCLSAIFVSVLFASSKVTDVAVAKDKPKLDIVGILLAAVGLMMVIVGTLKMPVWGILKPLTGFVVFGFSPAIVMTVFGLIVLTSLLMWEKRYEKLGGLALIPAKIIYNKQVQVGLYIGALFWVGSAAPAAITIPYIQLVGGVSSAQAGMSLIGMSVGTVGVAMLLPAKLSGLQVRMVCAFSLIGAAVAAFIMAQGLQLDGYNYLLIIGQTLMGCSVGAMASQCSIIVTDALEPREAQQSGGIQATVRNIGYAIGIAIMGVTMLSVMSHDYKQQVLNSPSISEVSQNGIEAMSSIPFLGDSDFSELIKDKVADSSEVQMLVEINQKTRLKAAQMGLYAIAIFMLLFLVTLRHLPQRSLMRTKAEVLDTDEKHVEI